ncbi:Adenylate and Guanylate cyclase catalytic domain containing protein [Tritrichomonas foetus]|uniref:Adenylate and Guanylate cyclase catalytic domain containing protein n=1 Tax=Tritrichomonas foetus TaxID=1144522 RepID=A0A1J4KV78_9EUKA|nr:Adenylate and Guanylate cyclase catalytic domain containing protein [Tritrichomonas foetus]|eukprot:OHT13413.1 Adenylate and Guanylate cyclase catalytic domain containing protein [Tritrichomonas foetus]
MMKMSTMRTMTNNDGDNKYDNLIKQSTLKMIKSQLHNLFTYLDGIETNFYPMHSVLSIWRIIQFIGSSLCVANKNLWSADSREYKALSVVSVLFDFVPSQYRNYATVIFESIFALFSILLIIFIFISCYQYRKTAKVSKYTPALLSIFMNIFTYIVCQAYLNIAGESVGFLFSQENYYQINIEISILCVSFLFFVSWIALYKQIGLVSCSFRPMSLITVVSNPVVYFEVSRYLTTFFLAVSMHVSKYPSAVLMLISSAIYFAAIKIVFLPGTFIHIIHQNLICASAVSSGIMCILFAIYIFVEKHASFIEIVVFFFLFILSYIAFVLILNHRNTEHLKKLDKIESQDMKIEDFKNPDNALSCIITGMIYAHSICTNWVIFRSVTEFWPENLTLWVVYAKFVAIYPNESNLLTFITFSINTKKGVVGNAKLIASQAETILMHRESALSPHLKNRLGKTVRHLQNAKTKIRHIWDLVIQGNVKEMEGAISNAYDAVNNSRNDYNFLISQYPNNRFVARAYARFLVDIDGDYVAFNEWAEKVKLLQRGSQVNSDQTQLLGLHTFPSLPENMVESANASNLIESESIIVEIDLEENQQAISEQISIIKSRIESIKIPAIDCIKWWSVAFLFIFYYFPAILMLIFTPSYLDSLTKPLKFMYDMSLLRGYTFQLPIFSQRYILENISFFDKTILETLPKSYGEREEMSDQIRYMVTQTTMALQSLNEYSTFKTSNKYIMPIHDLVFKSSSQYVIYTNSSYNFTSNCSILASILDIAMQSTRLLTVEPNVSLFDHQMILNPYMNHATITSSLSSALHLLSKYFSSTSSDLYNLIIFMMMFICIVYILIVIGIQIFELDNLNQCKFYIYHCLTALPKSVVSSVSESLRVLKNDTEESSTKTTELNEELSKQEENILKVFASASDATSSHSREKMLIITLNLLLLVFAVVTTILICQMYPNVSNKLSDNAPHLDYVLGAPSYLFSAVSLMHQMLYKIDGMNNINFGIGIEEGMEQLRISLQTYENYYSLSRYGGKNSENNNDTPPYKEFQNGVEEANNMVNCLDDIVIADDIFNSFECFPVDIKANFIESAIIEYMEPIALGERILTSVNDESINAIWKFVAYDLYNTFFFPMFDQIVPNMEKLLNSSIVMPKAVVITLLVIGFIGVLIILIEATSLENKMKFALSMLLHCPPGVVLHTNKIVDLLAGDFSPKQKDITLRHTTFFNSIVDSLPASIIITDNQFNIIDTNKATERILKIKKDDVIGSCSKDLFSSAKFSENLFNSIDNMNTSNAISCQIESEYRNGDDVVHLKVSLSQIGQNYIIESVDQTQTVSYNKLIAEEKSKSDKLLASILPPSLVTRVQNGEKNISFGVHSATILFLDIVEFTPWCASNTAAVVMSTLNTLFEYFDKYLATHSTMTKIKCIGDCYMAAGGIFVEINQPAIHAKEVVEFGQEAIRSVAENNKNSGMNLRIRVGVNTGGPIVAGVLGTEKPTFEILGKAINMAQQMEHHGVPMRVHISRSVYELIYGGSFCVKERGEIEIKNGNVLTYIVEDPTFKD